MRVLWDTTQSSTSLPFSSFNFVLTDLSFSPFFLFLHWSIVSKLLIQGSSWWWSSFFHGLFPSGWRLLSPLLLCLPLHLHGGKWPLKDLIEAQRSSLHRSPTSKLPSMLTSSLLKVSSKSESSFTFYAEMDLEGKGRGMFFCVEFVLASLSILALTSVEFGSSLTLLKVIALTF